MFESAKDAINNINWAMSQSDIAAKTGQVPQNLPKELFTMKGLSSGPGRIFLNALCQKPGSSYLEVGTHSGSSMISACFNNKLRRAVGIDDWSMDENSKPQLLKNLEFFKEHLHVEPEFIEEEAFSMDKSKLGKFDIYFYDGHHSADSQEKGLTCFWKNLAPVSIVIVDDYSIMRVQQGTIRAIDKLGCKQHMKYGWTLPGGKGFEHLYWGGLAVMVFEK